jgi:stress-induced morphogen
VALTDEAKVMIESALPGAEVEIVDEAGGDHLRATVSAKQFAGLSRIDQHKLVKAAVREKTDSGEIHSFSIRTIVLDD